jgi:hypothetical protein
LKKLNYPKVNKSLKQAMETNCNSSHSQDLLVALYWLVNHFEKQKVQVGTSHDQHGVSPVGSDSDGHLNDSDLDDSVDLEIAGLQKTSVASAVTKDPEIVAV